MGIRRRTWRLCTLRRAALSCLAYRPACTGRVLAIPGDRLSYRNRFADFADYRRHSGRDPALWRGLPISQLWAQFHGRELCAVRHRARHLWQTRGQSGTPLRKACCLVGLCGRLLLPRLDGACRADPTCASGRSGNACCPGGPVFRTTPIRIQPALNSDRSSTAKR